MPEPISASVMAGAQVAQTIANINDMGKRRNFEFAMGRLSLSQQIALEKDLARAKNDVDKLAILTNAVAMIRQAETQQKLINQGQADADKRKKDRLNTYLIVGGGAAALLITFLIIKI
jgi:hypothetical protein